MLLVFSCETHLDSIQVSTDESPVPRDDIDEESPLNLSDFLFDVKTATTIFGEEKRVGQEAKRTKIRRMWVSAQRTLDVHLSAHFIRSRNCIYSML